MPAVVTKPLSHRVTWPQSDYAVARAEAIAWLGDRYTCRNMLPSNDAAAPTASAPGETKS